MRKLKLVSNNPDFLDNRPSSDVIEIIKDRTLAAMGAGDFNENFTLAGKVVRFHSKDDQDKKISIDGGRIFAIIKKVTDRTHCSMNALFIMESFNNETINDDLLEKQLEQMEGDSYQAKLTHFIEKYLFIKVTNLDKENDGLLTQVILNVFAEFVKEGYKPDLANVPDVNGINHIGLAFNKIINEVKRTFVICLTVF